MTPSVRSTRICRARSPSVSATRVLRPKRIAALHLLGHLLDDGGLAFGQTGPHPLVLRARRNLPVGGSLTLGPEQAFHDLFWGAHPGCAGEHSGYRGHSLAVGFLTLAESHGKLCAAGLDHGNTLAIDCRHQDSAVGRFGGSLLIVKALLQGV